MTKVFKVLSFLFVTLVVLIVAVPCHADMPNPDDPPQIEQINVFRNLRETGDWLVLIYANIPYAATPTLPVTQAFIWRLYSVGFGVEYGNTVGYAYQDNGYGWNVYSMYFPAATVTANGMIWGTAYPIRLCGNPLAFATPPIYNYSIVASDYTTSTTQADNQAGLTNRVFTLGDSLTTRWALAVGYELILELETGTTLSLYGEAFFRNAIYGLQALAPQAFRFLVEDVTAVDRTWTNGYANNLTAQFTGTWIDTAKAAGQTLFQTNFDLLSIIIIMGAVFAVIIGNVMLHGDAYGALIDGAFILVLGPRIGMYGLGFLGLIAALALIYVGTRIWRVG